MSESSSPIVAQDYLCLNRLRKLKDAAKPGSELEKLLNAFEQLENLPTGRREELPFPVSDELWRGVCGSAIDITTGEQTGDCSCGSLFGCYFHQALKARRQAEVQAKVSELGKTAYDAYCACRDWKSYDGKPLPQWADVKPDIRAGWEQSALAVYRYICSRTIMFFDPLA